MNRSIISKLYLLPFAILFGILTSCGNDALADILPDEISAYCIWDKSPHCAFTDLAEYNGKVYCCFREATSHVPENSAGFGSIRILETTDGEKWESIGTISDPNYDLRDPKLSVTPDGRLMLLYGRYLPDSDSRHPWTMVKYISNAEILNKRLKNDDGIIVSIENNPNLAHYWIWRVKWIDEIAYGVAYCGNQLPLLVKSTDGINYTIVTILNALGNEADVEILSDGQMQMVMRAQSGNGFIGLSTSSDFTTWQWSMSPYLIHCPKLIKIDDNLFAAGRSEIGTTISLVRNNELTPLLTLPGTEDHSYPGMIIKDGKLWISWYASFNGRAIILFKRIELDELETLF